MTESLSGIPYTVDLWWLYKSFTGPRLEYSSLAWNPQGEIEALERFPFEYDLNPLPPLQNSITPLSSIQNLVLFSPCIVCLVELIDLFYSPNLLTLNFTLLYLMQSQFGIVYWNLQCVLPRFLLLNSPIINSYNCNLAGVLHVLCKL